MTNREIAKAFAAAFDPPLAVTETHHVDGRPVEDTHVVADGALAMTAIATGDGSLSLHFDRPDAAEIGRAIAGMRR